MKSSLNILCVISVLVSGGFCKTELFKHLTTSLQVGRVFPDTRLDNYISPGNSLGLSISSPYYKLLKSAFLLQYSQVQSLRNSQGERKIKILTGGVALSLQPANYIIPRTGVALISSTVDSERPDHTDSRPMLLDDKETEFGIMPQLWFEIPLTKQFKAELGADWKIIWSEPYYTHLLRAYLGVNFQWW